MKLTVGPLPSAVYWRRRVAVVVTLLLLIFALVYSCSGRSNVSQGDRAQRSSAHSSQSQSQSQSQSPTPAPSSSPSPQVFTPGGGIAAQNGGESQPASSSPSAEQPAAPSGPCTDAEMSVTAIPERASVAPSTFVRFTLRIKNVSNRSCTRDLGADAQELYLQDSAKAKVWSSDACDPRHGNDVRTFGPGIETEFWNLWDGTVTSGGCANRKPPPVGKYELVARLATKLSDPAPLELK